MIKIAFSWDDGAKEDMKLMELSSRFNMPAIFFIPASNPERKVLSVDDINTISANGFEIGSHTYSHTYLTNLMSEIAEEEMINGKDYLEQLLGKDIPHFCFPGGKYNSDLIRISQKHFSSVRTADTGAIVGEDPFIIKPAFHFYERGRLSLIYNSIKNFSPLFYDLLKNISQTDYFKLIIKIIEELNRRTYLSRIIIWGHSWELEKYNLWSQLEYMFRYFNENLPESVMSYSDLLDSNKIQ